jgi:hypothetical protein
VSDRKPYETSISLEGALIGWTDRDGQLHVERCRGEWPCRIRLVSEPDLPRALRKLSAIEDMVREITGGTGEPTP